ncbi:serine/threonine-protein kinase [Paenibacillus senegalimassiliensis]|uniref:serine/threonine-protein kinase n=1 Tax=Paenibacillus senegalimassiliensis TaxID=1737426 RepID=UPI00073EB84A|nr:serine/threonine-protein kinase [Paenibacillus senegalimassiliensis]
MSGLELKRNARLGDRSPISEYSYRIRKVLSASELAIVYVARNEQDGTKCVIKEFCPNGFVYRGKDGVTLYPKAGGSADKYALLREAFQQEGEVLAGLNHSGVVRCLARFEQNKTAYIVMEYCEGVTLDKYIAANRAAVTPQFFYSTMRSLIDTLMELHDSGIIHRDLKPGNVMISSTGQCKLLDFGSAVVVESNPMKRPILTTTGYSPLEFYSEQAVLGPESDIYSLAAVFYFCCNGEPPTDVRKRLFEQRQEVMSKDIKRAWPFLSRAVSQGLVVPAEKRHATLSRFKTAIWLEYWLKQVYRREYKY